MAVSKVQKTPAQPYNSPAYNKPRVISDTDRRTKTRNQARNTPRQNNSRQRNLDYPTVSDDFNQGYAEAGMQPSRIDDMRPADRTSRVETQYEVVQPRQQGMVPAQTKTQKRRKKLRKKLGARAQIARARVTAINLWVWGTGVAATTLLLTFALLSTAGMAMWGAIESYFRSSQTTVGDSVFVTFGKEALKLAGEGAIAIAVIVNRISKFLFGFDLEFLNPINLFIACWFIAAFIGIVQLFLTWFLYKASFVNPLGGEGATAKTGLFLLSIIFLLPFLIIFWPLFFFGWTVAVWMNPK